MAVIRDRSDDSGFSLVEVVVAMAIFTVLATISLGLLVNTTRVASSNIHRTAATNLVNTQLELARSLDAQSIPNGLQVTTQTIGNFAYTVTQTATYVGSNSATSVCTGTGNSLAYKLVTVLVTWPNMGNIKAVRGDTLRAVGVGADGLDATKGTVAVFVKGSTSQPSSGVLVTLMPGGITQTTGNDGCVVFTGLAPSTYSATANQVGYVGTANTQAATVTGIGVAAGAVGRGTLLYDTERSLNVLFDAPIGAIVPSNLPLRVGDSYVSETTLPFCTSTSTVACTTAVPGTVNNLFPESYAVKAGTCTETAASQVSIDLRPVSADASTVTVPVGAATVKVALTLVPAVALSGRTVTFTHVAPATGCAVGEIYTMTSATAGSSLVLPYGSWTASTPVFNLLGLPVGVTTQVVTFDSTRKTATVNLLVAL